MLGFLKIVFVCLLAIAAGVAAVAIPLDGRTAAEHIRALVEEQLAGRQAPPGPSSAQKQLKPASGAPPRMARQRPATPPADRPPAEDTSDEDREALNQLIGKKVR